MSTNTQYTRHEMTPEDLAFEADQIIDEAKESEAEFQAQLRIRDAAPDMLEALKWIARIADANHDDPALRANGARTLRRICDCAVLAINIAICRNED